MAPPDMHCSEDKEQIYIIRQSNKCFEHRESQATAMTVDFTGQWVLLAGRRHLALQRLGQDDDIILRKYYTNSKYEVSAAEFAVCPESKESCAIATSQHIDVVTWGAADPRYIHSLRGHTRVVTDIDWHNKNPNLLVSCSIDTFSHIWDLRDSRKPTLSLSAVCMSGATQVGFNRVSGNLLAAAHDGDLRIWDIRKGSCPIHYITAHLNRVHGINWSHKRETCLATASQDGTVKYFDINNPRRAEKIITTSSPVWRARYTPIGNGLVSIVVPNMGRGDNSLLLWSNSKQYDPVCSFVGHTDVILDFAWRPDRDNTSEIELVTWSRDRSLRVWKIDENLLKLCEPDNDANDNYNESRVATPNKLQMSTDKLDLLQGVNSTSPQTTARSSRRDDNNLAHSLTDQSTCSLHHEFSLLNTNIPHVEVNTLDAIKRYAIFKISAGRHVVILQATFPTQYPSPNFGPEFIFCQGTTLQEHLSRIMLKVLKTNALQRVKKSRTCLEQCLRALVTALKKSGVGMDKSQFRLQSPRLEGALSGTLHGACIPFPRTSSVTINTIGTLCFFAQSLHTKRLTLRHENITPRTLSAINGGGLLGNVMGPQPVLYTHRDSNTSYYMQDRMNIKHTKNARNIQKNARASSAIVYIFDCSKLLNINRNIAKGFSLDKRNIIETCRKNLKVCETNGRMDVLPIWKLAEMIATPNIESSIRALESKYEMLFYKDPFKKLLLEALIMHFAKHGDLQMAVTLACLFHKCPPPKDVYEKTRITNINNYSTGFSNNGNSANSSSSSSSYQSNNHAKLFLPVESHPVSTTTSATIPWKTSTGNMKQLRSNSWSDSLDGWLDAKLFNTEPYACTLIRSSKMPLFDQFKKVYAEILFGWQLITTRALILKHTMYTKSLTQCVEFMAECPNCHKSKRTSTCSTCQRPVMFCTLCGLPVKGAANACLACGHGGHLIHIMQWFKNHNICASGCGCPCLEKTSAILENIK